MNTTKNTARGIALPTALLISMGVVGSTAASITASDNAYVKKGELDQTDSQKLFIKSNGADSNSRLAYIRFDVTGLSVNASDLVFLDLNVETVGSANLVQMDVWAHNNGTAETGWDSSLIYADRPDGAGNIPNASLSALGSYAYTSPGNISLAFDTGTFQTLLANDSNNELTLAISNNSAHNGGQTVLSALGNSSSFLEPTLRIVPAAEAVSITASSLGGELREASETTFSFLQSGSTAKVGESGSGNSRESIHMMLFQLPERPTGGFQAEDTSLRLTAASNDVSNSTEFADLWAVGFVPQAQVGSVGDNLNDGGATDIDDFFMNEADTESKAGWNTGSDNTVKVWDDLAGSNTLGELASPVSANEALTAYINSLYDDHGAVAGDYLVLRNNYDTDMTNYRDWDFNTGSSSTGQPVLTLSAAPIPEPSSLALLGIGGLMVARRRRG